MAASHRELHRADGAGFDEDDEDFLLPKDKNAARDASQTSMTAKAMADPLTKSKDAACRLPWFGSWSATLLAWVVASNLVIFLSLPSTTFKGKIYAASQVWYANALIDENAELQAKLQNETLRTQRLEGDARGAADLRAQIEELQKALSQQRSDNAKEVELIAKVKEDNQRLEANLTKALHVSNEMKDEKRFSDQAVAASRHDAEKLREKLQHIKEAEMTLLADISPVPR